MDQGFVEGDEEGGCELGGVCDCWEIVAGKNGIQGRQQNRCSRVVCHRQTSTTANVNQQNRSSSNVVPEDGQKGLGVYGYFGQSIS